MMYDDFTTLYNGFKFYLNVERNGPVEVPMIARSLSRIPRYNGHTTRFYSVAEHCCVMAKYVEHMGGSSKDCRTALHHDNAETIIGDLNGNIKRKMPEFKAYEARLDAYFASYLDTYYPFPQWLKDIDFAMLSVERRHVMQNIEYDWAADKVRQLEERWIKFFPVQGRFPWLMKKKFLYLHNLYSSM